MPGLEDLYKEIILDHYRNPRSRGRLESPPALRAEGFNPRCGDEIVVYADVHDGRVAEVRIDGQGCSISISSASMMAEVIQGKTVDEVRSLVQVFKSMMSIHEASLDDASLHDASSTAHDTDAELWSDVEADDVVVDLEEIDRELGDVAALRGVLKFQARIKCATLSWNTLVNALDSQPVA